MTDEYIRKELYEAGMKEIRAIFETSVAKQEAIAAQLEKDMQERQKQYEIDNAKRDEHYKFLEDTYMQELQHMREYTDAKVDTWNLNLTIITVIIAIIAIILR